MFGIANIITWYDTIISFKCNILAIWNWMLQAAMKKFPLKCKSGFCFLLSLKLYIIRIILKIIPFIWHLYLGFAAINYNTSLKKKSIKKKEIIIWILFRRLQPLASLLYNLWLSLLKIHCLNIAIPNEGWERTKHFKKWLVTGKF